MHLIIGILIVVGSFLLSIEYMSAEFSGFINAYSGILLLGVPIGLMMMSYKFTTIGQAFVGFFSALFSNADGERKSSAQDLIAFGREVRRDKGLAASTILEKNGDPLFRHLGQHVLQNSDPDEIAADALVIGDRSLEPYRAAERVLASLGDYAPAMGMIGTVIGLIQLLANMRDFEKLGPGMAIALLTTFYGLVLANLFYLPLSRLVGNYIAKRTTNMNLIIEGMLKLARRRPIHEVQEVIGGDSKVQS